MPPITKEYVHVKASANSVQDEDKADTTNGGTLHVVVFYFLVLHNKQVGDPNPRQPFFVCALFFRVPFVGSNTKSVNYRQRALPRIDIHVSLISFHISAPSSQGIYLR